MIDCTKIQDAHMRQLLMDSESLRSRPEAEAQAIIDSIVTLDTSRQKEMMAIMEEEQQRIKSAKLAKGITPEMEIEEVEKNSQKLTAIKHEYNTSVRKYKEEKSETEDKQAAENILDQLNKNIP